MFSVGTQTEQLSLEDVPTQKDRKFSADEEEMNLTETLVDIETNGECTKSPYFICIYIFLA